MKTRKITRTPYTFELQIQDKETPLGVSETVPNQSISLTEMLRKHIAGVAPAVQHTPQYDDDANFDSADYTKINSLDLSEKDEIRQALSEDIHQMKERLKPKPKPKPTETATPKKEGEGGTTTTTEKPVA